MLSSLLKSLLAVVRCAGLWFNFSRCAIYLGAEYSFAVFLLVFQYAVELAVTTQVRLSFRSLSDLT